MPFSPSTTASPSRMALLAGSVATASAIGWNLARPVIAAAGVDGRLAASQMDLDPVAVELDLVNPGITDWWPFLAG